MDETKIANNETQPGEYSLKELCELATSITNDIIQIRDLATQYVKECDRRKKPTWLNSIETRKLLKISKRTIQRYRDDGVLRYTVFHNNYRYHYADVMALVINKNRK